MNALFTDEKQEEFLGVVKMQSTYIERYERNLIQEAVEEAVKDAVKQASDDATRKVKESIALKMKADGFSPDFIFKYCGIIL